MSIPFFERFSSLKNKIPNIKLGNFPTPIVKLESLCKKIGAKNIYLKNDGLCGDSSLFGGNKIRKLEFLLADALAKKEKAVATIGCAGSNHALTTAACAKKVGLDAYSVISPQLNATYLRRNLLLTQHYGGKILCCDTKKERNEVAKNLPAYFIPLGGSSPIGALGFVNAIFELKKQIDDGLMPEPDYIYVAIGSAGTTTGLILGLRLAGMKSRVVSIRISDHLEEITKELVNLLNYTNDFLYKSDIICPLFRFNNSDVDIRDDFFGGEYALVTPDTANAIKLLYETESIKLDGTYTGKAFASLLNDVKNKDMKGKTILFWNTFCAGDFSEITDNVDYKSLPEELHKYFEQDVQMLDQGV